MFTARVATFLLLVNCALPASAAGKAPEQEIRDVTEKLQTLIRDNHAQYKSKPESFYAMVDEVVVPHFDQKYIGQIVLGRHWRSANEAQRARFVDAFKNSLVHSYAEALLDNHDTVKTTWKPSRIPPDAKEGTVSAELQRKGRPAIQLGFSVHKTGDNAWKVYDVVVDGISLAANFRSQFSAEVKATGIDGVTKRLESGGKPLQDESALKKKSD